MIRREMVKLFADFIRSNQLTDADLLVVLEWTMQELSARLVITRSEAQEILDSIRRIKQGESL